MVAKDRTLVRKVLEGDRDAFGALVERYTGLVYGVILHKVRRPDEVEDLVQDVFCKAFQELGSLREPHKFAAWLGRIALNRAQGWLRQYQTQQTYCTSEAFILERASSGKQPDHQMEAGETSGIVWEALDRLRPEYRQILLLYHFENCRQQDIARFLNITLPTVKWRLLRARQNLERKLEEVVSFKKGYAGQEGQYIRTRRIHQKVMAALPLAAFFRPAGPPWSLMHLLRLWGWGYNRLLPVAYAITLGVLGSFFFEVQVDQSKRETTPEMPHNRVLVRLENRSLAGTEIAEEDRPGPPMEERLFPPCASASLQDREGN